MIDKIKPLILVVIITTLSACGASVDEYNNLSKAGQKRVILEK